MFVTVHKVRLQPSLDILHGGRQGPGREAERLADLRGLLPACEAGRQAGCC